VPDAWQLGGCGKPKIARYMTAIMAVLRGMAAGVNLANKKVAMPYESGTCL